MALSGIASQNHQVHAHWENDALRLNVPTINLLSQEAPQQSEMLEETNWIKTLIRIFDKKHFLFTNMMYYFSISTRKPL